MRVPRRKACRPFPPIWRLKLVAVARSLSDRETNTRLNIYSHMSTNPENLVKIGEVCSEISLLRAIVRKKDDEDDEKKKVTAVKHKLARPACSLAG